MFSILRLLMSRLFLVFVLPWNILFEHFRLLGLMCFRMSCEFSWRMALCANFLNNLKLVLFVDLFCGFDLLLRWLFFETAMSIVLFNWWLHLLFRWFLFGVLSWKFLFGGFLLFSMVLGRKNLY